MFYGTTYRTPDHQRNVLKNNYFSNKIKAIGHKKPYKSSSLSV